MGVLGLALVGSAAGATEVPSANPEATAAGASEDEAYQVRLDHRTFVPGEGDYASGLAYLQERAGAGMAHVLVQVHELPDEAERMRAADRGLILQGYVTGRTYYALASTALTEDDLRSLGVRWMAPIGPAEKISARVQAEDYGDWTAFDGGRRILSIQFHEDVSRSEAEGVAAAFDAEVGGWIRSTTTLVAALRPESVADLAAIDGVKYVSQLPPVLSVVNDGAREALSTNTLYEPPYGLDGSGSHVLVYDGGLMDANHPDYASRLTIGEGGGVSSHATHVGGTVGGDGTNSGGDYKGMAPGARITSYHYEACSPNCLYNSPQDIEENYAEGLFTHSTHFATNSLGSNIAPNGYPCDWEGDYEGTAQLLDAICGGSLGVPFLSVWAAGNERAYGTCGTGYNTTGVPATAKNTIVVGATNSNDHSMTYFSSWGPVDDGRIRPDICAPGCEVGWDGGITSTAPGGGYSVKCGTSMATPVTSGVIALILEQWRQSPGLPLSALPSSIKALLVNTAHDYGNTGPDYQFGYGEIRPVEAVEHLRDGDLLVQGAVADGGEVVYNVEVSQGQPVLKATIAWDDIPGQILAAVELVNDLDLRLESPAGTLHDPWILNPASPATPATRGADHLNPMEQVLVDSPQAGVWKVRVRGYAVPQGPQRFSLVVNAQTAPSVSAPEDAAPVASGIGELANHPNPFWPRTTLRFGSDGIAPVSVRIFDAAGREVRSLVNGERRAAGVHYVTWDGKDDAGRELGSGVYFYQVVSGETSASKKMLRVR